MDISVTMDYVLSKNTTPNYLTNDQAKASVKCLKTTVDSRFTCTKKTRVQVKTSIGGSVSENLLPWTQSVKLKKVNWLQDHTSPQG